MIVMVMLYLAICGPLELGRQGDGGSRLLRALLQPAHKRAQHRARRLLLVQSIVEGHVDVVLPARAIFLVLRNW